MKIEKNKVVALSYELMVDGGLADKATQDKPLEYIQGMGMLIPKFESELEGKEPGESFAFTLSPEEGYGPYFEEYKVDIPISAFAINGEIRKEFLVVGRTLPMLNQEGQVVQGTVCEVTDEKVVMDFNHPMAGKTLNFTGKVETVREATEKELKEGLHGEFLPPEEGCHCHGKCHKDGEGEGCHHGEGCGHNGDGCGCGEGEGCGCGEGDGDCGCSGDGECSCGGDCNCDNK